jgi:hypothetical protein
MAAPKQGKILKGKPGWQVRAPALGAFRYNQAVLQFEETL